MDNEEIISVLETMASTIEWDYPLIYAAAIDKAIEALKKCETLNYYIEQVEQFIQMLEDDIKDGEGTVITRTKLSVYAEVLKHLNEIKENEGEME